MVSTNNYPFLTLTYENIIDDTLYSSIKEHISEFNILEKANVYSKQDKTVYTNEKKRNSYKLHFNNKNIFDQIQTSIINKINNEHTNHTAILLDKGISYLRYEKDMYFDWHRDFEKIITPNCACYTLLVSINKAKKGGETQVKIDDTEIITWDSEMKSAFLFRSNL